MSNFDIERAKRGETVQCQTVESGSGMAVHLKWTDCHFVGLSIDGFPVVQNTAGGPFVSSPKSLRMKPKPPIQMWVQVYHDSASPIGVGCSRPYPTKSEAAMKYQSIAIGEPQAVLVPDES